MKVQTYVLSTFLFALLSPGVSAGPAIGIVGLIAIGGFTLSGLGLMGGLLGFSISQANKENDRKEVSSSSVASQWSHIRSVSSADASKASVAMTRASHESNARAEIASLTSAQAAALSSLDPTLNVFTFDDPATRSKRSIQPEETLSPMTHLSQLMRRTNFERRTISTDATGWPIAPAGVPQFNFDDCMLDIRAQLAGGGTITVFQPEGEPQTVQADHVPPSCMVLANVMLASGAIGGARPIAFGSASLKWLHVTDQEINDLKAFFNSHGKGPGPTEPV